MFVFNVTKERQSINLFCYRCYIKILILGKCIHPKFTLKCGCGVAGEARVGWGVCAVSGKKQKHPQEPFCLCLTSRGWGCLERTVHGIRPSNFCPTPVSCDLHKLSQAFCCLQSKTCETLSMLVYWLSVEMTAVERCRPVSESVD